MNKLLAREVGFTAVFCMSDIMAVGAMRALTDAGLRVPQDISVLGYRVAKYIGAYVAAMNGVDAIAFTAGIGENTTIVRAKM